MVRYSSLMIVIIQKHRVIIKFFLNYQFIILFIKFNIFCYLYRLKVLSKDFFADNLKTKYVCQ